MIKIDEIKEIIKMVNDFSIQHFELEHETTKILIVKNTPVSTNQITEESHTFEEVVSEAAITLPEKVKIDQVPVKATKENKEEEFQKIAAPMVGTFYSSVEPGEAPFVKIGKKIDENTVVCILEAMKLFNEIPGGVKGEIVEILAKDGEFVEYGQPLFLVRAE